jgi:hypothetical protein
MILRCVSWKMQNTVGNDAMKGMMSFRSGVEMSNKRVFERTGRKYVETRNK